MGIGSITLGILSFLCMLGGIFLVWVPFLGAMLGFLSPVLALFGIILGGVALSRAREGGSENEGLAIGGLVTSIIAFVPAVLVAVTCSLCSACWTGAVVMPHDSGPPRAVFPDAGSFAVPYPPPNSHPAPPPVYAPPAYPPPTAPLAPPVAPPVAPPAAPPAEPPTEPPTEPATTGEPAPITSVPGSSGPALPPPPLPAGPHVRGS